MMTKFILFLIVGFSVFANAASDSSTLEYFYQAPEGVQQLTPSLAYHDLTYKYKNGGKITGSGFDLDLRYERGLTNMFSAGGIVSYKTMTLKGSTTGGKIEGKGLGDIQLFLKGHTDLLESRYLWFGVTLTLSPGASEKKDKSSTTEEQNAFSGEHTLSPYVGYTVLVTESLTFGAKVQTEVKIGDGTEKETDLTGTTTTAKTSGGEISMLSLFLESPIEKGNFGGFVQYSALNPTKSKENGSTSTYGGANYLGAGVYGTQDSSEGFTLRGDLAYKQIVSDMGTLSSSAFVDATIAGRFTF